MRELVRAGERKKTHRLCVLKKMYVIVSVSVDVHVILHKLGANIIIMSKQMKVLGEILKLTKSNQLLKVCLERKII